MSDRIKPETRAWAAERFGIPEEDVLWFNSGTCYSRVLVATRESADKVSEHVRGSTVNGGQFGGMALGHVSETPEGFDVMV